MRFYKKHKKLIKTLFLFGLVVSIFGLSLILLWISTFKIPTLESFAERKVTQSTKIYDRTGEVLLYDVFKDIKRTVVPFEEISINIKNATIATEDTEFYNHLGVRPVAFLRAAITNLITFNPYGQGGSTITQQVVKNSVLTQEKTISRKLKEWVLAVRLEQVLSKDQILGIYLNETPYGGSVYGIEEASQYFLGKKAKDLNIAEAAYLAALPQAPTYYSPYGNHLESLENRKNFVLSRMLQEGFIDQNTYEKALVEKIEFAPQSNQGIKAPHFVIYVRELLTQKYGEDLIENGGLSVTTTLDWDLQQVAEEIVKKGALENKQKFDAENASLLAIDPKTGEILVMVGSRDYFDDQIDGNFNIALASRQPGSSFKPFAYAEAFTKGYTPETVLFDLKTQFSSTCPPNNLTSEGSCYSPTNYTGTFRGPITMREALAQSVNVPAIKTLYLAGLEDTLNFAKDLGIETLTDPGRYGLTLVIGGGEVRLLDMVSAYGVFANEGIRNENTAILEVKDKNGNILEKHESVGKRILDQNVALQISDILSDNAARTPVFGAQSSLYFPNQDVAVKTGTTNDYRDGWVIGYTPNLVAGAWAGNNDNHSMKNLSASAIVAPLWHEFMNKALATRPVESFPNPETFENTLVELKPTLRSVWLGGISHLIDTTTGKLASPDTPTDVLGEITTGGVHSILHWVDKNNPRGPIPTNPEQDPQYLLWEYPVQKWVATQNISLLDENDVPTDISDSHSTDKKPKVSVSIPKNIRGSSSITITPSIQSFFSIKKVEYYLNSIYLGDSVQKPFSITFVPNNIDNISSKNTLRVVVYDSVQNKTESSSSFNVNL